MNPTVVCVLRSGGEYKQEHVWALYEGVKKHWPSDRVFTFLCLTDELLDFPGPITTPLQFDYPGWWSKMELFSPRILLHGFGGLLYFDLDTVIVGDLTDITNVRKLTLLSDFYRTQHIASGMMFIPQGAERHALWDKWVERPRDHMRRYRGDQEFMRAVWGESPARWQNVLPGQVISYKAHVRKAGSVPENTRVVCFHGRPRPWAIQLPGVT